MSWSSPPGVDVNIVLVVDPDAEIKFLVNPDSSDSILLVIGNSTADISLDPSTVETLRDKADEALATIRDTTTATQ